jgi:hypothetical protein
MGWLGVVALRPLWLLLPLPGMVWLVLGGVAYTMGAGFFAADRLRYGHFVWHVFVLAGTSCHVIAVCCSAAYGEWVDHRSFSHVPVKFFNPMDLLSCPLGKRIQEMPGDFAGEFPGQIGGRGDATGDRGGDAGGDPSEIPEGGEMPQEIAGEMLADLGVLRGDQVVSGSASGCPLPSRRAQR